MASSKLEEKEGQIERLENTGFVDVMASKDY